MKKRLIGFLMAFVLIVSALPTSMITVHAETFDISLPAAQTEGGEITTYTYAEEGDEVTVYVAPDENYALTALTVSGDNVNLNLENGITKATDNIYIFTMPGTAVSIMPEFSHVTLTGTKLTYDTENGEIRIKSDTSYDNIRLIAAEYTDDGRLVDVKIDSIDITAGETYIKDYTLDKRYNTKLMLWTQQMMPLATVNTADSINASSIGNVFVSTAGTGTYSNPVVSLTDIPNTSDRHTIGALDVSIKNGEELNGIAEIRIKYDKSKGFDAQNLLPGYFNPETNQWETVPYMLDEEHGEVVILTDHFSRFGLFEVERSGTPTAFAKPLTAAQLVNMPSTTASKLLGLAKTGNMDFNEDAVAEVLNALDGSYNNNYTNTVGAVNTLISKGGAISTGFLGTIGKQFAIIGVTAAAINTAKTVYTKGVTTDTALTTGKSIMGLIPYPPIQIAYATYGLAEMAYTHYDEKVMTENKSALLHHFKMFQYEKICKDISQENYRRWHAYYVDANPYADDLTSKMTYWNDYGMMEYWDARFKSCYDSVYAKDVTESTSENAAHRFERFKSSITAQIYAYAHEFSADFARSNRYMLKVDDWNKALAAEICENYAAQLMNRLSPLFKKYSLLAYDDAIKLLEKECEELRTELNKTVTLNFYEDDGSGIAKDCYILFDSAKDKSWRADFDSEGKATLSFSLLGYGQLRCPDSAVVYNKNTEKPIGRIPLPDGIDPGETYSIPFHPGDFTQTVKIHEVLEKSTDDYMFAGLHGRLCDLTEVANAEKFHFTLDSKGRATLELSLHDYVDAGAPEWLEIIDAEGGVVYQTRFSIAMTDIPLGGNSYGVNIRCGDNASIKKYRNSKAKIVYYENEDAEPEVIAETTVDYEGRARLLFDRSLYEFKGKKYWLYVCYTDPLENIELFEEYDLSRSFQNGKKVKNVVLSTEPQYKEELRIKESTVTLGVGDGKQITVLAGEISDLEIGDETVATSTVEGYIVGHNPGTTTITYMNQYGSRETVTVTVTKPVSEFYEGYYKVWQISETQSAPKFDISDEKTWNIGERLIDYAHVQFHIDRFSGKIDTVWITYQSDLGRTYCYSDDSGAVSGEGIDFAGRLIRLSDGSFDENDYLENVFTANFKHSLTSYMGDFMFIQGCYFEETDLDRFPD